MDWADTAGYVGLPLIHVLGANAYLSGEKLSGTETGSTDCTGSVGTPPKLEKWSLHEEWCSAVQAAHPFYGVLRVPCLEVHRSLPNQEPAGGLIEVSLHCC